MNIKIDSREIVKGDTFIAIRGKNDDGHNYILDAIKRGASKVVVEYGEYDVDYLVVDDTKKYLEDYLYDNYYDTIKDINLIGVTGTNGKTTISYLIYQALNLLDIKCAYIGTIGFYLDKKISDLNNTTPSIYDMYNLLLYCKENNCKYVSMEVSSQGIDMGRVNNLHFKYAIFTNLTQDHLDYHKNINNYMKCKQQLFKQSDINIINSDDNYSSDFYIGKYYTYGKSSLDYKISDINYSNKCTTFSLNNKLYYTKLIGEYNVYNISSVIVLLNLMKIKNISEIIETLIPPIGRLDIISKNNNSIVIDYAHTPDAVEKIINAVKKLNYNRIITIIGCGGNRDKTKRSIMGEISTNLSDYVIFTSDNPRYEKPKKILKDITCKLYKKNYKIIVNRKKAIKKGIQMLTKNDILLLLGKGHENYQIIKNKKINFSDKDCVLKYWR